MILVLAVVVACVYAVVYLMKRSMNKDIGEGDQFLRVVSSVSIAPGKSPDQRHGGDDEEDHRERVDERFHLAGRKGDAEIEQIGRAHV